MYEMTLVPRFISVFNKGLDVGPRRMIAEVLCLVSAGFAHMCLVRVYHFDSAVIGHFFSKRGFFFTKLKVNRSTNYNILSKHKTSNK